MLKYNEVYVLEINQAHWEGRKEELLQILNDYKIVSERANEDYSFIFLPLKDYSKLHKKYRFDHIHDRWVKDEEQERLLRIKEGKYSITKAMKGKEISEEEYNELCKKWDEGMI